MGSTIIRRMNDKGTPPEMLESLLCVDHVDESPESCML